MITQQFNFGKLIALGFLFLGIFLLLQVILPIVSFQIWEIRQSENNGILISPTSPNEKKILGITVQSKNNFPTFISSLTRETKANYKQFRLTIPKLKVEQAQVSVDSNDLLNNLAHLPGSALPGEKGNVFISGHSASGSLFGFQKALFSKLPDLKKGDELIVEAGGAKFKYQVMGLVVVSPDETSVIHAPEPLGRYISLMTCVPPGLNLKRLVVLGKMI